MKRRLKALKKIQLESTKIEAKFYEEVHKLECKYHEMYKPLYDQRAKITKGKNRIDKIFLKICYEIQEHYFLYIYWAVGIANLHCIDSFLRQIVAKSFVSFDFKKIAR